MEDNKIIRADDASSLTQIFQMLQPGKIRELNDITDLCGEAMAALLRKDLNPSAARELRQWAELMYTCVQSQQVGSDGDVNYITQLIQMNGGPAAIEDEPRKKIEEVFEIKKAVGE